MSTVIERTFQMGSRCRTLWNGLTIKVVDLETVGIRTTIVYGFEGIFTIRSWYLLGLVFDDPLNC